MIYNGWIFGIDAVLYAKILLLADISDTVLVGRVDIINNHSG